MLRVEGLSCGILRQVNLQVARGGCTAICGASGSGKTTLLNAVAGWLRYQGQVYIDGVCVDGLPPWRRRCRHLHQRLYLFPFLTIERNLALAQFGAGLALSAAVRHTLLQTLEIAHLARRYPGQLSGGEQQRAALARALAGEPLLLLLDEPFSGLDWPLRQRLWASLRTLQRQHAMTLLLVSHEPREVEALADCCYYLRQGRIQRRGGAIDRDSADDETGIAAKKAPLRR